MARSTVLRRLTRRRFLQCVSLSAGSLFVAPRLSARHARVGIVGAGAAGLAAAYWLKQQHVPFKIFEASSRTGGRVHTVQPWKESRQFIELGGELINTNDAETLGLARHLRREQERALRLGRRFTPQDLRIIRLKDLEKDPNLHRSLFLMGSQVYTDGELMNSMKEVLPRIGALRKEILGDSEIEYTYREMQKRPKAVEWDRKPLSELLEWMKPYADDWVIRVLKNAYEEEWGMPVEEQSSLNLISMLDTELGPDFDLFGQADEALRIGGGNSAVIRAIINSLTDYGRRSTDQFIEFDRDLSHISRRGNQLECNFKTGKPQRFTHLIIAVPLTQLRRMSGWENLNISQKKLQLIQQLGMGQNTKAMLEFKERFWRNRKIVGARASVGELFVEHGSGLMWETSRGQNGKNGILTHYSLGGAVPSPALSLEFVTAALTTSSLPYFTGRTAQFNWAKHPLTQGSFSGIKPGQYSEFWGAGHEPECGGQLIFAGEHTSTKSQGFINGAYESGLRAARQVLHG